MPEAVVGIVGGGAAGLFAGCFLKSEDIPFVILEKGDKPGRKFLLTGHGRCNITNRKSPRDLKEGYYEAGKFIYSAINSFPPESFVEFIENKLGVKLKEEDNNRMFPVTDDAGTILNAMIDFIGKENIKTNCDIIDIMENNDGYKLFSSDNQTFEFCRVILATGGRSFPKTGSDGNGYKLAANMGHTITPLVPALSSIDVSKEDQKFTSSLSGVSVNAGTSLFYDNSKKAYSEGDVLFTHKGLSGPAIQKISREIPRDVASKDGWIELDFTPSRNEVDLDKELISEISSGRNAKLTTLASSYVPNSVAEKIGARIGVTGVYSNDSNKVQRKALVQELKHLKLHIDNPPCYEDAYVTRGGVSLKEIKRDTMESKLRKNLYFIGEMIDVDGVSGGYNLQACASEAFIAVRSVLM